MSMLYAPNLPERPDRMHWGRATLGVLGSDVLAGSIEYASLDLPADNAKRFRAFVPTWPVAGTMLLDEDGVMSWSGLADGTYSFAANLIENGVTLTPAITVSVTVGGNVVAAAGMAAGAAIVVGVGAARAAAAGVASGAATVVGIASDAPYLTTPILSAATASGGIWTGSGSVVTTKSGGYLWWRVDGAATASDPGASGMVAAGWTAVAVAASGQQTVASFGELSAGTQYVHYLHVDASGNRSTVADSAAFVVSAGVVTAPTILTHPQPVAAYASDVASFSVTSTGAPPLSYQWRRNGVPIPGANGSTLNLTTSLADDGAAIDVAVSNAAGTTTSRVALVRVVTLEPYDSFMPLILAMTPGCPWPTALHQLTQVAIDWFQRTLCWRDAPSIECVSDDNAYALPLPAGALVAKIIKAWFGGSPIAVLNMEDGLSQFVNQSGTCVWTEDRASVFISPAPVVDGGALRVSLALKPSQSARGIPKVQFDQFATYIADGTIARLLGMSGKKWHDPTGSSVHQVRYEAALASAQGLVSYGFARSAQRVRPQTM